MPKKQPAGAIDVDWEALYRHYAVTEFITRDPVSFAHTMRNNPDWRDMECVAFLSALFSYGRRDKILETVSKILTPLGKQPLSTLITSSATEIRKETKGFYYRFNKAEDLAFLLIRLSEVYQEYGSLKSLWQEVYQTSDGSLQQSIHHFRNRFLHEGQVNPPETYGLKFLFADPMQQSAAKRFNMFLRWMVRSDSVDLGLWSSVIPTSELIIPLDTHVATMARRFKITHRKANDWKTATEITEYFRKFCPQDPVRYDFALFGLGID